MNLDVAIAINYEADEIVAASPRAVMQLNEAIKL